MPNPYNCTMPGNLFCGYVRLRQRICGGLVNGESFALLGGRRCGKTSLLLQIENDLNAHGLPGMKPVPCLLDVQGMSSITPEVLFEQMYRVLTEGTNAPQWEPFPSNRGYDGFLEQVGNAHAVLDKQYGDRWLAVFLIDELDSALYRLKDDQFFQNLRHLLMMSPLRTNFRIIATGVRDLSQLISSGCSPLNNLTCLYTRALTKSEARELIRQGFDDTFDEDIADRLLALTGKHPYLMQGLLAKVWDARQAGVEINPRELKNFVREFVQEHHDMYKWVEMFGEAEHHVYRTLANAPDGVADIALPPALACKMDEALRVLSYHGVIDDTDEEEPRIGGTMFRDWYRSHYPETPPVVQTKPELPQGSRETNSHAGFSPVINVTVSPVIDVSSNSTASTKVSLPDAQRVIEELKQLVSALDIDAISRKKTLLKLDQASLEVESGVEKKKIETSEVEASFKQASNILKSAGATAETLRSFIEKAKSLGPYIGMAADLIIH